MSKKTIKKVVESSLRMGIKPRFSWFSNGQSVYAQGKIQKGYMKRVKGF